MPTRLEAMYVGGVAANAKKVVHSLARCPNASAILVYSDAHTPPRAHTPISQAHGRHVIGGDSSKMRSRIHSAQRIAKCPSMSAS